jgi:hypothetical protein
MANVMPRSSYGIVSGQKQAETLSRTSFGGTVAQMHCVTLRHSSGQSDRHFQQKMAASQVQNGLVNCGLRQGYSEDVEPMLDKATIVYHELDGDEQAANRDLLELSLCARFGPPFRLKAQR